MLDKALTADETRKPSALLVAGIVLLPIVFAWFTLRMGYSTLARGLSFGWLALLAMSALTMDPPAPAPTAKSQARSEPKAALKTPVIEVTSGELESAYAENEFAAQQRFGGKQIAITGVASEINLDLLERPEIKFLSTRPVRPSATLEKDAIGVAELKRGQEVRLVCGEVSEVLGRPILGECIISAKR